MSDPWFDPMQFGMYFGAIGGSAAGILGGTLGALTGALAPRGKARTLVVGGWVFLMVVGVASLAMGVVAVIARQPYAIWYPLVLMGALLTGLTTSLLFARVLPTYRAAEARKLAAEELRRA